jgi:hypothetical protein
MTWVTNGRGYTTGAAGRRCYFDLRAQVGESAANRIRDLAIDRMAIVRVNNPGGRGQEKSDVTVEGFLLAAGVPQTELEAVAKCYRSGKSASVDLRRWIDASATGGKQ